MTVLCQLFRAVSEEPEDQACKQEVGRGRFTSFLEEAAPERSGRLQSKLRQACGGVCGGMEEGQCGGVSSLEEMLPSQAMTLGRVTTLAFSSCWRRPPTSSGQGCILIQNSDFYLKCCKLPASLKPPAVSGVRQGKMLT